MTGDQVHHTTTDQRQGAVRRRNRGRAAAMVAVAVATVSALVAVPELRFAPVTTAAATPVAARGEVPAAQVRAAVSEAGLVPGDPASPGGGKVVVSEGSGALAVGVRDGGAGALVRTRDGGGWGPWRALEPSRDDGGDRVGRGGGTEPVWVDGRAYQVWHAAGTEVLEVREQRSTVRTTVSAGAQTGGASKLTPNFELRRRSTWGARTATSTPSVASQLRYSVVHHSASSNTYTADQVPQVLRSVQAFHMDGRGWSDIAYNIVVDRFGAVWEGRTNSAEANVVGAHAMGFNTGSLGVMVLGDYTTATASPAALESVAKVLGWKAAVGGFDPTGTVKVVSGGSTTVPAGREVTIPTVVGHRDIGATSCPGSVYDKLASVRARARQWQQWYTANRAPSGAVETVAGQGGKVVAVGYAHDRDATSATVVRLKVGTKEAVGTSALPRPDLAGRSETQGWPTAVGYRLELAGVAPGVQTVCVAADDQGGGAAVQLGCRQVLVEDPTGHAPVAVSSGVKGQQRSVGVGAQVRDADGPGPYQVAVLVDGRQLAVVRTDREGRTLVQVPGVDPGQRQVCLKVTNTGAGSDTTVACHTTTVVK